MRLHRPCAASAPRGALLGRVGFVRPAYAGVRRGMRPDMRGDYVVVDYSTMQPARPAAFGIDGRLGDGAVISCGRVVV